jgi:hypothetical protein
MIPYITNRGGPMVGLEALSMQGLPVDELLLTRESEDNLADLAGNAMSTTVVGTCIIAALIKGNSLLRAGSDKRTYEEKNKLAAIENEVEDEVLDMVMKTDTLNIAGSIEDHICGEDQLEQKPLDLSATSETLLTDLLVDARKSARLCECEGRKSMTEAPLYRCQDCGSTSCKKCKGHPSHNFQPLDIKANPRLSPSEFGRELKSCLPMALVLSAITQELLDDLKVQSGADIPSHIWEGWSAAVLRAAKDELRFVEPKRQEIWVVNYQSTHASLELSLNPQQPEWRFFAHPDPEEPSNSPLRALLEAGAVGRLRCDGSLFAGRWEFALPSPRTLSLTLEGSEPVPSWEAKLGLQGPEFRDKTVPSRLQVSVDPKDATALDRDISGMYILLDKCGTANGALHRRTATPQDEHLPPVFFMFDPSRCGAPEDDAFVFTISTRRLEYGETRPLICRLDSGWRQSSTMGVQTVKCEIPSLWVESVETCLKVLYTFILFTLSELTSMSARARSQGVFLNSQWCVHG